MNIYLENGYLDYDKLMAMEAFFIFIIGGRGIGKTYGGLKHFKLKEIEFMYMRRTQTQLDMVNTVEFSPWKQLNEDLNWKIFPKPIKGTKSTAFYDFSDQENPQQVCYTCALTTIKNMRGFGAANIKALLYDEFIPEKHEKPIKGEFEALFNAYETINRNRELEGSEPLKLIALSNSNDLGNPIFIELGIIRIIQKMRKKGGNFYFNKQKSLAIFDLTDSPISEKKKETAVYRLTAGTDFKKMSIDNDFSSDKIGNVKSMPLQEYKPIVEIGDLCIYEHKSNRTYYATTHKLGSPVHFGTGEAERARFVRAYRWIWDQYMENNIEFEEYLCEILLTKAFK